MADRANQSQDYELVGRDAAAVAKAVDLAAVKGRFAFDVPDAALLTERRRLVGRARPG